MLLLPKKNKERKNDNARKVKSVCVRGVICISIIEKKGKKKKKGFILEVSLKTPVFVFTILPFVLNVVNIDFSI